MRPVAVPLLGQLATPALQVSGATLLTEPTCRRKSWGQRSGETQQLRPTSIFANLLVMALIFAQCFLCGGDRGGGGGGEWKVESGARSQPTSTLV